MTMENKNELVRKFAKGEWAKIYMNKIIDRRGVGNAYLSSSRLRLHFRH